MLSEATVDSRSDLDLIAALNGGEAGAFDVLYFRHRDWVAALALRFTGDHALSMDVLQETFLYLLGKFPGFALTCQLKTFLYPAVRNLSLAAKRKAERNQESGPDLEDVEAATSHEISGNESVRDELSLVLATLSETHREVLLLRFVDDLSLGEIALATEVPLGTVKSRLHHALEILRRDPRTRDLISE
ncbi:MAG TPA: sigma-70 family RNA polymerase sigma factor [Candidatus Limnocylindria bacterium]|nr:sigma-70 family RNA polymerase sigma factor [Candidatus Limnocylindria bacterium]